MQLALFFILAALTSFVAGSTFASRMRYARLKGIVLLLIAVGFLILGVYGGK